MAVKALCGLAVVAAGCSGEVQPTTGTDGPPGKDLKIVSLNPSSVYIEGQDLVTMKTENGCGKDKLTLKVGDITVTTVQETDKNTYTFTAPANDVGETQKPVNVNIVCSAPPDTSFKYGKNAADFTLIYDPNLEPNPRIVTASPQGSDISVLARVTVVFSRPMNPETVKNKDNFGIVSKTGKYESSPDNKTFTFIPDEQLAYSTQYTVQVTVGALSAKRAKPLKPTLGPNGQIDPNKDTFTFTTRCEGCGNPWLGDISAAAGISSGGTYKLFSVTGQPTPVGEATNEQYKLQSGFIYATAPGQ
jgi:hypothetical protein